MRSAAVASASASFLSISNRMTGKDTKRKTWYGDALETVSGHAGTALGGLGGGVIGAAVGAPTLGASAGSAIGGGLATKGIQYIRDRFNFHRGGFVHTDREGLAVVHDGELVIKRENAKRVKSLMREHGMTVPSDKQIDSLSQYR